MSKTRKTSNKKKTETTPEIQPVAETTEKTFKDIVKDAEDAIKQANEMPADVKDTKAMDMRDFNIFVEKILSDENTDEELNSNLTLNEVQFFKGLMESKIETMKVVVNKITDNAEQIQTGNSLIATMTERFNSKVSINYTLKEAKNMINDADEWTNKNEEYLFGKKRKNSEYATSNDKKLNYNKREIVKLLTSDWVPDDGDVKPVFVKDGKLHIKFNTKLLFSIDQKNKHQNVLRKYGYNFDLLNLDEFEQGVLELITIKNIKYVKKYVYPNSFDKFINKLKSIYNRLFDINELDQYENKYGCKVEKIADTLVFKFEDKSIMFKGVLNKALKNYDIVFVFLFNNSTKENEITFEANFILSAIRLVKEMVDSSTKFYQKYLDNEEEAKQVGVELDKAVDRTVITLDYLKEILEASPTNKKVEDLYTGEDFK